MSTPPSPHEGTPAEQPPSDTPTAPGPAVPAGHSAPAGADSPATPPAGVGQSPTAAPAPPVVTRRRRFLGWARTPVGVGVLVAAAMLVLVVLPCALGSFALGYAGGHGERGDRGGYGREFGDQNGPGGGRHGDGRRGGAPGLPGGPGDGGTPPTTAPSPSASAGA